MRAFLGIIGKGADPGISARVLPYPGQSAVPEQDGGASASDISSRIAARWALLSSNVQPHLEAHTMKVSRHVDSGGARWTWIGLYQSAAFAGEGRGGHYFGVGLALDGLPPLAQISPALWTLYDSVQYELFDRPGVMQRSIFDLAPTMLRYPPLDFPSTDASRMQLDPGAELARFVVVHGAAPEFAVAAEHELQSPEARSISALYLGNYQRSARGDFYVPIDPEARPAPPPPATAPIMTPVEPAFDYSGHDYHGLGRSAVPAPQAATFGRRAPHRDDDQRDQVLDALKDISRSLADLDAKVGGIAQHVAERSARHARQPKAPSDWKFTAAIVVVVAIGVILALLLSEWRWPGAQ